MTVVVADVNKASASTTFALTVRDEDLAIVKFYGDKYYYNKKVAKDETIEFLITGRINPDGATWATKKKDASPVPSFIDSSKVGKVIIDWD